jgi:hypothetical protein
MAKIKDFLTIEQAKRGIYIDFEGFKGSKRGEIPLPHVLGAWCNGKNSNNKLYLLRDYFKPLGRPAVVSNHWASRPVMNIDEAILELIEWSTRENRLLLYFSKHEKDAIKKHCTEEVSNAFSERSRNAKLTVNEWHRKKRRGIPKSKSLKWYFSFIKYENQTPEDYKMTLALKKIEAAVQKTTRWKQLDKKIQDMWAQLVMYNLHDCKGLKKLTNKAANGLHAKRRRANNE